MEISYAVIADYANISREGKPNIMGIFDRIWTETFPCNHGQMFLVTSILAELLDAKIKDWEIKIDKLLELSQRKEG